VGSPFLRRHSVSWLRKTRSERWGHEPLLPPPHKPSQQGPREQAKNGIRSCSSTEGFRTSDQEHHHALNGTVRPYPEPGPSGGTRQPGLGDSEGVPRRGCLRRLAWSLGGRGLRLNVSVESAVATRFRSRRPPAYWPRRLSRRARPKKTAVKGCTAVLDPLHGAPRVLLLRPLTGVMRCDGALHCGPRVLGTPLGMMNPLGLRSRRVTTVRGGWSPRYVLSNLLRPHARSCTGIS
jgi:hypothetical protein